MATMVMITEPQFFLSVQEGVQSGSMVAGEWPSSEG